MTTTTADSIMSGLARIHVSWRRWQQGLLVGQGITLPQLEVLRALEGPPSLNPSQLAEILDCDRPTMSCILRNLQAQCWVGISLNPDNAKFRDVRLTARGLAALERITAHLALPGRAQFDPLAPLSACEQSALAAALQKLAEQSAESPRPPTST